MKIDRESIRNFIVNAVDQQENGCWLVKGRSPKRYPNFGALRFGFKTKTISGHRLSFIGFKGLIPEGMEVCHTCDTPLCVNPGHLFIGTAKDNAADRKSKGRNSDRKGAKNHYAKLTDKQVAAIRASKLSGATLADRYDVTRSTISQIRAASTWAHAGGATPVKRGTVLLDGEVLNESGKRAVAMYRSGVSLDEIAESLGTYRPTVSRALKIAGVNVKKAVTVIYKGKRYPNIRAAMKAEGVGYSTLKRDGEFISEKLSGHQRTNPSPPGKTLR